MRTLVQEGQADRLVPGQVANAIWLDIAECARIAGLDFKVDAILNGHRGVIGLFAGDCVEAWMEGVKVAEEVYRTEPALDADIVIANGYGKGNEAFIGAGAIHVGAGKEKDMVVIATCPQGQVVHYLYGDFGDHCPGSLAVGRSRSFRPGIRRMILFTPYPELSAWRKILGSGEHYVATTWPEVLALLNQWHPNGAQVGVYPDLTIQYLDPVKAQECQG